MQLSLQMKFNQEMEKLQIIFINIMTRLTAMFEKGTVPRILKFFGFKEVLWSGPFKLLFRVKCFSITQAPLETAKAGV